MHRYIVFFGLLLLLCSSACRREQFDDQLAFVATTEVPAGLNSLLTHNFPITGVRGTTLALTKARPYQIQLFLEQGEPTFDFVRQAFLLVQTDSSQVEIAYNLEHNQDNRSSMVLLPSEIDLLPYITQPNFTLLLKLNFHYTTVQTSRIRVELGVGVNYD